eukprot:15027.XXX_527997_528122_1 [CDS] Oithona nana genome sequencing.
MDIKQAPRLFASHPIGALISRPLFPSRSGHSTRHRPGPPPP